MDIYGVYSRFKNGCRLSLMNMAYCDSIDISEKQVENNIVHLLYIYIYIYIYILEFNLYYNMHY